MLIFCSWLSAAAHRADAVRFPLRYDADSDEWVVTVCGLERRYFDVDEARRVMDEAEAERL